jgi:hypothetical protein
VEIQRDMYAFCRVFVGVLQTSQVGGIYIFEWHEYGPFFMEKYIGDFFGKF